MCLERHHQRSRERPRLRTQVPHLAELDAGLFHGLAAAGVFKVLPRLHKSGGHRIQPRILPCRVVLQQQTVVPVHDGGNDRRLHAWEQHTVAVRLVGASLRPSGERRPDRRATGGAEPLAAVPDA